MYIVTQLVSLSNNYETPIPIVLKPSQHDYYNNTCSYQMYFLFHTMH